MIQENIVLATLHHVTWLLSVFHPHGEGYFPSTAEHPGALTSRWLQWGTPATASAALRRPSEEEPAASLPPFFPSPWFMHHHLALWQHRGPLVKPCCHSRWHLPPYLHSKCQKRCRWLFDFYLFMWCFFPATPLLLNNFQTILYRLKEGEKKKEKERKTGERAACVRELSGGCHVGLLCSAYTRPRHEFMSLKMQKKVYLCKCLHGFLFLCACAGLQISFRSFDDIINIAGLKIFLYTYIYTHVHIYTSALCHNNMT